ncbi:MAG: tyrosine-type recombinase/integrase [Alphaproteobacteria bacterium]|nr:tyrosine-type recombinase/integrase [Alphaproteobacteria bacterium]OJV45235.1 MAG: hypothetical protein BGO28_00320 [Alphaproteobacteria bacterium 43-37]
MPHLTKKFVDKLASNPNKDYCIWDDEIKGFGVRLNPGGTKTYLYQYRNNLKQEKRHKIGVHGKITTEQAREQAKTLASQVSLGIDPSKKQQPADKVYLISNLADEYIAGHASTHKRKKSREGDIWLLERIIIPAIGKIHVKEITQKDISHLHQKLLHKPYQANRVLALLSKMFSLAVNWGWVDKNPVIGVSRYFEEKRERWLQDEELDRLWQVLDQYNGYPTADAIKMLILTGARKGEVLNATWDQFDFNRGVWIKPSHLTKQKKTEHVPLSEEALAFLLQIKEGSQSHSQSQYLFPGRKPGEPLYEIKKFWATVLKKAGIENLRIHDLRHTYASHLVSSGLSLSIVGKLLGHTQAATTQRYAHLADQALRDATNLFASKLKKITQKDSSSNEPAS